MCLQSSCFNFAVKTASWRILVASEFTTDYKDYSELPTVSVDNSVNDMRGSVCMS